MSQTIITAGDASTGLVQSSGNDGTLVLQTGAAGAKVNALSFAADGTPTLIKPLTGGSLTLGTVQNTTSGTSIDFTGIPSWAKRITLMLNSVSLSGAANMRVQLGSGAPQTTGYLGAGSVVVSAGATQAGNDTAGFVIPIGIASGVVNGSLVLTSMGGNLWSAQGIFGRSDALATTQTGGAVQISGVVDRLRLTSSNGTDTFDLGSANIMYEG